MGHRHRCVGRIVTSLVWTLGVVAYVSWVAGGLWRYFGGIGPETYKRHYLDAVFAHPVRDTTCFVLVLVGCVCSWMATVRCWRKKDGRAAGAGTED